MRTLKFMLFVGLFLLCGLVGAVNPDHDGTNIEVAEQNDVVLFNVQINTLGLNFHKQREEQKWYQVRWIAKSCPLEKNSNQKVYEFGGELDAVEAGWTAIKFMQWPERGETGSYNYEFECYFMDYEGDDPEGITAEPAPAPFAYVKISFDCYRENGIPRVNLSSRGKLVDETKLDFFDVTVSKDEIIESVSVDTINPDQNISNK